MKLHNDSFSNNSSINDKEKHNMLIKKVNSLK